MSEYKFQKIGIEEQIKMVKHISQKPSHQVGSESAL